MTESTVGVINQSNATIAPVDVAQVTNPATGATAVRENVVIADANNFGNQATVSGSGRISVDDSDSSVLTQILIELRAIKFVLAVMSGIELPPILEENELQ